MAALTCPGAAVKSANGPSSHLTIEQLNLKKTKNVTPNYVSMDKKMQPIMRVNQKCLVVLSFCPLGFLCVIRFRATTLKC